MRANAVQLLMVGAAAWALCSCGDSQGSRRSQGTRSEATPSNAAAPEPTQIPIPQNNPDRESTFSATASRRVQAADDYDRPTPASGRDLEAEDPSCELRQLERKLDDSCGVCHLYWPILGVPIDCVGECPVSQIDLIRLIEGGLVVPGDAEGSLLLRRIRDGSMPPPTSLLAPLSEPELDSLKTFIDALDPAALPSCPLEPERSSG